MEADTYPYDIALILTVESPSYRDALEEAKEIAAGIGQEGLNISAVDYYELDNEGQRVLYLHKIYDRPL